MKPWRDEHGNLLTNWQLRIAQKTWTKDDWEGFLSETIDIRLKESYLNKRSPSNLDHLFDEGLKIQDLISGSPIACSDLRALLQKALKKITAKQITILKHYYLEHLTEKQIADQYSISRNTVSKQRKRALKKLREEIGELSHNRTL